MQALLDDYLAGVLAEMRRKMQEVAPDAGPAVPAAEKHRRGILVLTWLFEAVVPDDPRMRRLLTEGQAGRVEEPFPAILHQILDQRRAEDPDQPWQSPEVRDAAIRFYTGAIVSLLRLRMTRPEAMSTTELAALAAHLITFGRAGPPHDQNRAP